KRFDAASNDDATTDRFAAQLVVQLADARRLDRAPLAHGSIPGAATRSSFALAASVAAHSTSRTWSASSAGSMSRCSISRLAPYSMGRGRPASHSALRTVENGR